jgi:hypothetical protein
MSNGAPKGKSVSEENSVDSTAAAPVTQSLGPTTTPIPRQSGADDAGDATPPERVEESFGSETVEQSFESTPLPQRPVGESKPESASAAAAETADEPKVEVKESVAQSFSPGDAVEVLGTTAAAPEPRKRRRGLATALFLIVILALLAASGYLVWQRLYADPTRNAKAGDCLADLPIVAPGQDQQATSARVVPCTDPAAGHEVIGRVDNQTADLARSQKVCDGFTGATHIYRAVPDTGTGYVLCLKKHGQ